MNIAEIAQQFAAHWWQVIPTLSLQIAALVILIALLTRLARPWAAQLRYALWGVVVARLAMPFVFRSPLGLFPEAGTSPVPRHAEGLEQLPLSNLPSSAPLAGSLGTASAPLETSSAIQGSAFSWALSWEQGLVFAWAVSVLFLSGLWLWRHHRVRTALARGATQAPASVVSLAQSLVESLGLRRPVRIRMVDPDLRLNTPAVFGVFRPQILLPRELVESTDSSLLEPVLLHELTHLRRRDHWINAIQGVVQILYFFHPLVWWANREMRRERELACDEAVVQHLEGEARGYMSSLLEVARSASPMRRPVLTLPAMAANRSFLGYRLERLSRLPKALRPRRRRILVTLALVIGVAASLVSAASSKDVTAGRYASRGGGEVVASLAGGVATITESRSYALPEGAFSDPTADLSVVEPLPLGSGPRLGKLLNPKPPKLSGTPSGTISGWVAVDPEGKVHAADLLRRLNSKTDEEILTFLRSLEFEIVPPPEGGSPPAAFEGRRVEFVYRLILRFQLEEGRFVTPPPEAGQTSWTNRPERAFALAAGQNLAVVSSPFPSARMDFFKQQRPIQAQLVPDGPQHMLILWDDLQGAVYGGAHFGGSTLGGLLRLVGLDGRNLGGDPSLLENPAPLDIVLRQGLEVEQLLPELEEELQRAGIPVRFEVRKEPREVIVVRGEATPLAVDPRFRVPVLHVYAENRGIVQGGPGAELPFDRAMERMGNLLQRPVAVEFGPGDPGKILLAFHGDSLDEKSLPTVLANLEAQSGLEFSLEERPMEMVYLLPAEA